MAILKFEIDTDDIGYDEEGYGDSFERIFNSQMKNEITDRVVKNITKEEIGQYSILVQENVDQKVLSLFENLLNEDIVLTGRYGDKEFIGSVEDYIKKSIDEKYMYPVDTNGQKLKGCTSTSQTWIQWRLESFMEKTVSSIISNAEYSIGRKIERVMESTIKSFIDKKINSTVEEKLKNVGIRL